MGYLYLQKTEKARSPLRKPPQIQRPRMIPPNHQPRLLDLALGMPEREEA
jgi:hypothetical protein